MAGNPQPPSASTASIDLSALASNYRLARRLIGSNCRVLAMIKGDAYGHGAEQVGRSLVAAGCDTFGVATVAEASALQELGRAKVVLFGGVLPSEAGDVVRSGAEAVVSDPESLQALASEASTQGRRFRAHLGLDTGMRRLGAEPEQLLGLAQLATSLGSIDVVGLCSHFADAEAPEGELLNRQLEMLRSAALSIEPLVGLVPLHAANSAGLLQHAATHLDLVRPGLMLYGLSPRPGIACEEELRPVMRLSAPVLRVTQVQPGEGVGYGHAFRAERVTTLATVRIGYADGYPRCLSGVGKVWLGGLEAPVVGRVCMDHLMVDVTDADGVSVGDHAVLWGPELRAERVAEWAQTISYELVSRVGARVLRTYPGA